MFERLPFSNYLILNKRYSKNTSFEQGTFEKTLFFLNVLLNDSSYKTMSKKTHLKRHLLKETTFQKDTLLQKNTCFLWCFEMSTLSFKDSIFEKDILLKTWLKKVLLLKFVFWKHTFFWYIFFRNTSFKKKRPSDEKNLQKKTSVKS